MKLLPVLMFLILVSAVSAEDTNVTATHNFEVNDVVQSTTGAYSGKLGLITNVEIDSVYVRWEGSDAAVMTDPNRIEVVNKEFPETFVPSLNSEAVYISTPYVNELYNEIKDSYEMGTCDDNERNQGETGVDCGGPCPLCEVTPTKSTQMDESKYSKIEPVVNDPVPFSSDPQEVADAVQKSRWARSVSSDLNVVKDNVESTRQAAEGSKTAAENIRSRVDTVNSNVNQVNDKLAAIERPIPEIRSKLAVLEGAAQTGSYIGISSLVMVLIALSVIGYLTYTVVALKKELHVVTETTEEDLNKLVEYFRRMTSKGYSSSVVKRELIKQGFTHPQVDLALKKFEEN